MKQFLYLIATFLYLARKRILEGSSQQSVLCCVQLHAAASLNLTEIVSTLAIVGLGAIKNVGTHHRDSE